MYTINFIRVFNVISLMLLSGATRKQRLDLLKVKTATLPPMCNFSIKNKLPKQRFCIMLLGSLFATILYYYANCFK